MLSSAHNKIPIAYCVNDAQLDILAGNNYLAFVSTEGPDLDNSNPSIGIIRTNLSVGIYKARCVGELSIRKPRATKLPSLRTDVQPISCSHPFRNLAKSLAAASWPDVTPIAPGMAISVRAKTKAMRMSTAISPIMLKHAMRNPLTLGKRPTNPSKRFSLRSKSAGITMLMKIAKLKEAS